MLLAEIEEHSLFVAGCYMPLPESGGPGSTLQVDFWRWLLAALGRRDHHPMIVAGDWNTCTAADGAGRDLRCAEHLVALRQRGWRSAFRAFRPDERAHSWWHHGGNGFRIDDAYVSPAFAGDVVSAEYVTAAGGHVLAWDRRGERPIATLSDHAALLVELELR